MMLISMNLTALYAQTSKDSIKFEPTKSYNKDELKKIAEKVVQANECDSLYKLSQKQLEEKDTIISTQNELLNVKDSIISNQQGINQANISIIQGKDQEIADLRLNIKKLNRKKKWMIGTFTVTGGILLGTIIYLGVK